MDAGREHGIIERLMSSAHLNGDGPYIARFAVNVQDVNTAVCQPLSPSLDGIWWAIVRVKVASHQQPLLELHWFSSTEHRWKGQQQYAGQERAHMPNEN